jgi:protein O-GlcNAc transferase
MRAGAMTLAEALHRAFAAHQARHLEEAERMYGLIIRAEPKCFDALHLLGVLKAERGLPGEAERLIRKALALEPRSIEALNNRANVLQSLRRYEEALTSCERALAIKPDYAEALNNRGNILHDLRRHDEALESYAKALAIRPDYAKALANRAEVLRDLNRFEEALVCCDKALAITPDLPEALNNRGLALHGLKRPADSLSCYDQALAIRPDYTKAFANRARVLVDLGRYEEALASFDRALRVRPGAVDPIEGQLRSEYLSLKRKICDWTAYSRDRDQLIAALGSSTTTVLPFVLLGWLDDPARLRRAAQRFVDGFKPGRRHVLPERARTVHEKIRLGYVSPDFRNHAVAHLTAETFELHDRGKFELHAFSLGRNDGSSMHDRLARSFDRFVDARQVSDFELARQMRTLEIDLAIDLGGFTQGCRPAILAYRPAPIQINYLGYPGTMGADFIDYAIVDPFLVPAGQESGFNEKLVRLPDCYQANDRKRAIAERTPTRAECGLPEGGFVFACFNNTYKLTPAIFDTWMRLVRAVPGSVLWLLGSNEIARRNLCQAAQAREVSSDRLVFAEYLPLAEHLARHRLADLFLDTLPYGAHVTASDALWAGLPVLTCAGRSFASRVAGSLLHAVGLPELVTETLDEYEALALRLAGDPQLLGALRVRLADNRLTAPLFDSARHCRHLEDAYQEVHDRWHRGEPARSFAVAARPV